MNAKQKLSPEVKQRRKDARTVGGLITQLLKQKELPGEVRALIERAAECRTAWKADKTDADAPVDMKKAFIQGVRKLSGAKGRRTRDAIEAARLWLGIAQPAEESREEELGEAA